MRLYVLSDLHMEFAPFEPPATDADAVILAGDISTGLNGLKWAQTTFPNRPIVYVLGNHEFYGQKLQKLLEQLKAMAKGTQYPSRGERHFHPRAMSPFSAPRFGQILL
jgi:predicted phosphodiesterase